MALISDTMNVYLNWFKVIQLDDKLIATRDDDKENSTTTTSIRSSKRQTPSFGIQSSKLYFVKLSERISPKFWILVYLAVSNYTYVVSLFENLCYVFGLTCVLKDVFPVLATLSDNSWTSRRARHVCALFRAFWPKNTCFSIVMPEE